MEGLASVHHLQALSALLSPNNEDEEEDFQVWASYKSSFTLSACVKDKSLNN